MKITMHKATDGSIHATMTACKTHESNLKTAKVLENAAFNLELFVESDRGGKVLCEENLSQFIVDNAAVLRKLLTEATITRRPRKAASVIAKAALEKAAA